MLKLEASWTPFQGITYPLNVPLSAKQDALLQSTVLRAPCNPFLLTSKIVTEGWKAFKYQESSDVKGGLSCPSTLAVVTNKIEEGGKVVSICVLTLWQLQSTKMRSWPVRFASGLIYLPQSRGKKAGLTMKEEKLALQPCTWTWHFCLF